MSQDPASLFGDRPWTDFTSAAQGAVEFLHARLGLDVWMVTELQDDQQVALVAAPGGIVRPGTSLPWSESFCSRMVAGVGPRVATVTAAVPEYAGLSWGPAATVSAYVGVPLVRGDGTLFGSVCGFATRAQPPGLSRNLPLVELIARMLSTVLTQEAAGLSRGSAPS